MRISEYTYGKLISAYIENELIKIEEGLGVHIEVVNVTTGLNSRKNFSLNVSVMFSEITLEGSVEKLVLTSSENTYEPDLKQLIDNLIKEIERRKKDEKN